MSDHYLSSNPDFQGYQYPSAPSYFSVGELTNQNLSRPYDANSQQDCNPPPDFTSGDQFVPSNDRERHSGTSTTRIKIAHPYARLFAKTGEVKRRKIWNHALEKSLFSPYELYVDSSVQGSLFIFMANRSALGAPHRRTIYMSSLEAHIDRLHTQLLA
jgi:hypothetical protein